MIDEQKKQQLKDIKQSFRLMMNGVTAQSQRDKGLSYHINWGVDIPSLKMKAKEIGKDYDLAIELWKENVRECKILATMIMPAEEILPEVVDIWMEQTQSQEIAEIATFNLYQHLPFAAEKAYQWIASDNEIYQLCGFGVLSRLFSRRQEPNERGINEYIDQLQVAMQESSMAVKKSAMASIRNFADLGLVYERLAKNAMKRINLELF